MGNTTAVHMIRLSLDTDVHFRNGFVVMMVVNFVGSVLAFSLNVLIILAFVKLSSLRSPSNILILSLAMSDFGVGLLVQPAYFVILFALWTNDSSLLKSCMGPFKISFPALLLVSLSSVAAITVDRFLALRFHLRYQELVTSQRYFIAVLTIWILSWLWVLAPDKIVVYIIDLSIIYFVLFLTIVLMVNISRVVHRHSSQLRTQQQPVSSINMPRYKKSINTMYYIIAVFVVCNSPYICMMSILTLGAILGKSGVELISAQIFTFSLLLMNSTLNPVIYFWRIQEMRCAVVQMLRSFCWKTVTTNEVFAMTQRSSNNVAQ